MKLYKTTIVIWSKYNGAERELKDLALDATNGNAYCSRQESKLLKDPTLDLDWDDNEFFFEHDDG